MEADNSLTLGRRKKGTDSNGKRRDTLKLNAFCSETDEKVGGWQRVYLRPLGKMVLVERSAQPM
jgi:hypothetical protein